MTGSIQDYNPIQLVQNVSLKDFTSRKRKWGKLDTKYESPFVIQKNLGKGLYTISSINDPSIVYKQVTGAHLKCYLTLPTSLLKKPATITPEQHCLSKQIDQVDLPGIASCGILQLQEYGY